MWATDIEYFRSLNDKVRMDKPKTEEMEITAIHKKEYDMKITVLCYVIHIVLSIRLHSI
jgi:hypothetical protein